MRIGKAINAPTLREKQLEKNKKDLRNTKGKHKTHAKRKKPENKNSPPQNPKGRLLKQEKKTLPEKQMGEPVQTSRTKKSKKKHDSPLATISVRRPHWVRVNKAAAA